MMAVYLCYVWLRPADCAVDMLICVRDIPPALSKQRCGPPRLGSPLAGPPCFCASSHSCMHEV